MSALKKTVADIAENTGAFAGESVGLVSSTCFDQKHAGAQVSLYSSTCISEAATDALAGDATHMVSSTCIES